MGPKVQHVVADAGAFIRNAPLRDIAGKVYTVPEVIAESCDRATRQRLKVLPVEMTFKEPSSEALLFMTDFSKKTGDYRALSVVDLKVLALTYDLEKQHKGIVHLRKEPPQKTEWAVGSQRLGSSAVAVSSKQYAEGEALPSEVIEGEDEDTEDKPEQSGSMEDEEEKIGSSDEGVSQREASTAEDTIEEDADADEEEEEEEDDDEGWITPGNIAEVKKAMGVEAQETGNDICVGCLTTDFAMQNVLIQVGLKVISVDGMQITRAKSFVLRCYGCLRITKDTSRAFCPHCGNKTLRKLTTSIDKEGAVHYHLAKNYVIRNKNTGPLPKPQGGKHAMNPQLFEDQPNPQQRASKKALQKHDILSADIIDGSSPFRMNDVTSRAAQLGITQWAKRNQNDGRKKGGRRKK